MNALLFDKFIAELRATMDNLEVFCKEGEYVHVEYAEIKKRMEELIEKYTVKWSDKQ
jgi:hypothetical protein